MGDPHIFRVTVRGRFSELSAAQRERLLEVLNDHHVTKAAFTSEGTFTYDAHIDSFSFRYEIRVQGGDPDRLASDLGLRQAEAFLGTLGFGSRSLRVTTTDMQALWAEAAHQRRG